MSQVSLKSTPDSQRGVAAILLLLSILLAGSSYLLLRSAAYGTTAFAARDMQARAERLQQARQALLAYAVAYADNYPASGAGPGHLPCPDRSPVNDGYDGNDGPDPPCKQARLRIGRFPRFTYSRDQSSQYSARKRIEFYPPLSLQDQQMWYVVSASHINNPVNTVVNTATRGLLSLDALDDIAAVIIEPGPQLAINQAHRPGDNASAYLEGENADGDYQFSQRQSGVSGGLANDLVTYITAAELNHLALLRVAVFVKRWLQQYHQFHCGEPGMDCYPDVADSQGVCEAGRLQGYLPLVASTCPGAITRGGELDGVSLERHWFVRNRWQEFFRYGRDPLCAAEQGLRCGVEVTIERTLAGQQFASVSVLPTQPR